MKLRKRAVVALVVGAALLAWGGTLFAQSQTAARGALVAAVVAGGPADKAGLVRGDIILSIGDKEVNTPRDVVQALSGDKAGDSVTVKFTHGDAAKTAQVVLEARNGRPFMGVAVVPPALAFGEEREGPYANIPQYAAFITAVAPGSPAAEAGLQPRDVVLSVDGTTLDATNSLATLIAGHKAGDTVMLSVEPLGGQPHDVKATLAQSPQGPSSAYLGVRYGTLGDRDRDFPDHMRDRGPYGRRGPATS